MINPISILGSFDLYHGMWYPVSVMLIKFWSLSRDVINPVSVLVQYIFDLYHEMWYIPSALYAKTQQWSIFNGYTVIQKQTQQGTCQDVLRHSDFCKIRIETSNAQLMHIQGSNLYWDIPSWLQVGKNQSILFVKMFIFRCGPSWP